MDPRPDPHPGQSAQPTNPASGGRRPPRPSPASIFVLIVALTLAGGAAVLGSHASPSAVPGTTTATNPGGAATIAGSPAATIAGSPAATNAQGAGAVGYITGPTTIVDIARAVGPSVVAIQTSGTIDAAGAGGQGIPFQAAGSGVIVDPNGIILTNRHVVGDADTVTVILADGRSFDGRVAGLDTFTDFALVRIDATGLAAARLGDSSGVQVGELAVAIGNPEGDLPGTVTAGIVSALEREIVAGDQSGLQASEPLRHLIQHDAAINPGNSGGPLLDAKGAVIGINTAVTGQSQGIGFALPIDLAKPIIREVAAGRKISRPYIGVLFQDVDAQLAQTQGLPVTTGALIASDPSTGEKAVIAGTPAAKAGLKDGDIVTAIDGRPVDATHQLDVLLLQHDVGDTVRLTIRRGDRTIERDLTLEARPQDLAS